MIHDMIQYTINKTELKKKKVHYMCANIFLMFRVGWNKEKWPAGWPESEWTRLNFNNFYMK